MVAVLIYSPDANNLNKFIANFARSLKVAEENRELTPQELKPFLVYARQFGVQNFNPQQEKAVAEFLSGSDIRKLAYGIWKALNISYGSTRQWRLNFPNFQSSTAIFQTKAWSYAKFT